MRLRPTLLAVLFLAAGLLRPPIGYAQQKAGELWVGPVTANASRFKLFTKQTLTTAGWAIEAASPDTDRLELYCDGANLQIKSSGDPFSVSGATFFITRNQGDYTTAPFIVRGSSDNNKQIQIGFNTVLNVGFIQSTVVGTGPQPLVIQPNGGDLFFGGGGTGTVDARLAMDSGSAAGGTPSIDLLRNGARQAEIAVASQANDFISGSAANDMTVRTAQKMIWSADLANAHASLTATVFDAIAGAKIGTGTEITKYLSATASLDYATASANTCATATVTVTGAAGGNPVDLGVPDALASHNTTSTFFGWVSAADTVTVRRCVITADGSDPAAATVRAGVWQH